MKKARRFSALLLSIVLVLSFASCKKSDNNTDQAPMSAGELWNRIDQTMSALESMEMTSTTELTYYDGENCYQRTVDRYLLTAKDAHYTQCRDTTLCPEIDYSQSYWTMEAYYEGVAYTAVNSGAYEQKLCTPMTHEEYDHTPSTSLAEDFQIVDCAHSEFSQGENGIWNLRFYGYGRPVIDSALESLGLPELVPSTAVTDMEVSLSASAEYYVQKMQITLLFSESANKPSFSVTAVYKGFNTTTFETAKLDPQEYTSVADIRILTGLTEALQQRQNADAGKFTLEMTSTYDFQGQSSVSNETDTVEYACADSGYTYAITSDMDGALYNIQYQGGIQTVTTEAESYTSEKTDAQAKAYIDSLIDSARYNSAAVTDVQIGEEGCYVLTCAALDIREYAAEYETEQLKLTNASQEITVSFRGGMLGEIKSVIILRGTYLDKPMTVTIDTLVAFVETQAGT